MVGAAGGGKGTIQKVITAMLGPQNVSHVSLARVEDRFAAAELMGKLLNASAESESTPLESTRFKEISAGDRVSLDKKFAEPVIGVPIAKHLISMNELPKFKEKSDAIYRRLIILEFGHSFTDEERDVHKADKLCTPESLKAILAWAVQGLRIVFEENEGKMINLPDTCKSAMERFKEHQEPLRLFINENCLIGDQFNVGRQQLYKAYENWCHGPGKIRSPLGLRKFIARIEELYHPHFRRIGKKMRWLGIGLKDETGELFDETY
jgi:putative DNA primase/helicase